MPTSNPNAQQNGFFQRLLSNVIGSNVIGPNVQNDVITPQDFEGASSVPPPITAPTNPELGLNPDFWVFMIHNIGKYIFLIASIFPQVKKCELYLNGKTLVRWFSSCMVSWINGSFYFTIAVQLRCNRYDV